MALFNVPEGLPRFLEHISGVSSSVILKKKGKYVRIFISRLETDIINLSIPLYSKNINLQTGVRVFNLKS